MRIFFCISALIAIGMNPLLAVASPGVDGEILYLRKDCSTADVNISRCKETMAELTGNGSSTGVVWTIYSPSSTNPLTIDIGPGVFDEFKCVGQPTNKRGWINLRGAGREHTVIKSSNLGSHSVTVFDCEKLGFQDLTVTMDNGTHATVDWFGGGGSTWRDVDIISENTSGGGNAAWRDGCSSSAEKSLHYFFNVRIWALGGVGVSTYAFGGDCSEVWFYGGEVLTDLTPVGAEQPPLTEAFNLFTGHKFQGFGTRFALKAGGNLANPNSGFPIDGDGNKVVNIWLFSFTPSQQPTFHSHGGIISSKSTVPNLDVVGIYVDDYGTDPVVHTPDSAHALSVGVGGAPIRLLDSNSTNTSITSPFVWGASDKPPLASSEASVLLSITGQDMYVENDCEQNGDCDSDDGDIGTESHLMVFNKALCASTHWLDTVTGNCRNDTSRYVDVFDLEARVSALESAP